MLSLEQIKIISEQLQEANADEFVEELVKVYSASAHGAAELLDLIPDIARRGVLRQQNIIGQYSWAMDLLLVERCMNPISKRKSKGRCKQDFPTLLYVCKVHFPDGNCARGSRAQQEFWNEFIECLKSKKGLDYENADDWGFIKNTAQCAEWLLSVIHQNIDADFVPPEISF